jgi:hypothetical protein
MILPQVYPLEEIKETYIPVPFRQIRTQGGNTFEIHQGLLIPSSMARLLSIRL